MNNVKEKEEAKEKGFDGLAFFIGFFLALSLVFAAGGFFLEINYKAHEQNFRQEAVDEGKAEWYINENYDKAFRWLKEPTEKETDEKDL